MTPTTLVVLAIVPDRGRYLIVEETDGTFYLPAGKAKAGEDLVGAVVRETVEEAGLLIGVRGLVGFDHELVPWPTPHAKLRFAFAGYLGIDMPPKSRPDRHSRRGLWATKAEIERLPLRHPEVLTWIDRLEAGAPLLPCIAYRGPTGVGGAPQSAHAVQRGSAKNRC